MNKKNRNVFNEDSINIIELFSSIYKNKKLIINVTLIFSLIGIIYSLSIKNIYKASTVFYPHIEKVNSSQGLRNLAGLAGINIGNDNQENIPPTLYPNLINSPQFKIEVLNDSINYNGNTITYRKYLDNNLSKFNIKEFLFKPITYFIDLFLAKDIINDKKINLNMLELSEDEYEIHKYLDNVIKLELNEDEGFLDLSVEDNNPYVASQIAKTANLILQKNIIDFKIKNINDTYNFIKSQLELAKINFYNSQDKLAIFKENNRNIQSDIFKNQYSRIEDEYLIAKNIYNELAINKEKIAIDVKKNTPIFTIIKPVVIPNEKSGPRRLLIVITYSFLGIILSSLYVIFRPILLDTWYKITK